MTHMVTVGCMDEFNSKRVKKTPFQGGLAFRSVFRAGAYIINPNLKTVTVLTVFESHKQLHI